MAVEIDGKAAKVEHLTLGLGVDVGAAQQGADARDELAWRKGFDEVVVRTKLEADDAVFDLPLCGEHDDGDVGGVTDNAADLLARKARKHEIQNDEVELVQRERVDGFLTICGGRDPIAGTLEIGGYRITNVLFVFDKQNATGFGTGVHDETPFGFLPSWQCTIARCSRQVCQHEEHSSRLSPDYLSTGSPVGLAAGSVAGGAGVVPAAMGVIERSTTCVVLSVPTYLLTVA